MKDQPKDSNDLRLKVVNYILSTNAPGYKSNWDRFKDTLIFNAHTAIPSLLNLNESQSVNNQTRKEYFEYMTKQGTFGTFTELSAA